MLQALPSSSHDAPSPAATALGELLIDTMWSIDLQLDEVIADSKVAIAAQSEREKEQEKEQVNGRPDESNAVLSRDAATKDKSTLQELVRLLLVRRWFHEFWGLGIVYIYVFSDDNPSFSHV